MAVRRSMRLASAIAFATAVSTGTDETAATVHVTQPVRVRVHAPPGTSDDAIYLSGSLPDVGSWRPDGVRLARQRDGSYEGEIRLRLGARLEYKLTRRGDWSGVERAADDTDRPNRLITIEANTTDLHVTVDRWAD